MVRTVVHFMSTLQRGHFLDVPESACDRPSESSYILTIQVRNWRLYAIMANANR
jgi:hypothetical protein